MAAKNRKALRVAYGAAIGELADLPTKVGNVRAARLLFNRVEVDAVLLSARSGNDEQQSRQEAAVVEAPPAVRNTGHKMPNRTLQAAGVLSLLDVGASRFGPGT